MENKPKIITVGCIGVDNRQHGFEPHKDKTICGVAIKRKKVLRDDYKLFSCFECDQNIDE